MMKNVVLSPSTQRKLEIFSTVTNSTYSNVVEEALSDWLDTVAQARLEALSVPALPSNVVCIQQFN